MKREEDTQTRQKRLDLKSDVLLLRVCIRESNGDHAEALMDYNLIKNLLTLQSAAKLVPGYWRNSQTVTPKKWLHDAMMKVITDDMLAREGEDEERDERRKIAHPVVHNRPIKKPAKKANDATP